MSARMFGTQMIREVRLILVLVMSLLGQRQVQAQLETLLRRTRRQKLVSRGRYRRFTVKRFQNARKKMTKMKRR